MTTRRFRVGVTGSPGDEAYLRDFTLVLSTLAEPDESIDSRWKPGPPGGQLHAHVDFVRIHDSVAVLGVQVCEALAVAGIPAISGLTIREMAA